MSLAGGLLIAGKTGINRLVELDIINSELVYYILLALKTLVNVGLLFLAISFLYWLAPAKRSDFRFFSPGSIVATALFILTSIGFTAYVNAFGQYNKFYGGVGTLMVILVWLYLNSMALLIGFELNVSIKAANAEIAGERNLNYPQ
ncbi:MAG: YihY/virulence factor BrkB family protein [Comamonadaceae bacterium]|nr:YihY/virulence factor BrkB family protein [Comamonadaceae bacterium]